MAEPKRRLRRGTYGQLRKQIAGAACSGSEGSLGVWKLIRLENRFMRVDILPELGGKIWNLLDTTNGKQWLWHNPQVPLQKVEFNANYDDHWAGGWEELFPNDLAGEFMGLELPDHGELWSQPWSAEMIENNATRCEVRLAYRGVVTGANIEKRILLESDSAKLAVSYRIENPASSSLYFLFKQHLAVAVKPGDILELPGGKGTPVDLEFSTLIGDAAEFAWPHARGPQGKVIDLSLLPRVEDSHREFVYLSELPEGWCGVRDAETGAALRLNFSRDVFPFTWLFMTFGGWRTLYTVVLEPCTTMPKDLHAAHQRGHCAMVSPGEPWECEVEVELTPGSKTIQ